MFDELIGRTHVYIHEIFIVLQEICLARLIHRDTLTWLQPLIVFFDISNISKLFIYFA